MVPRYFHEETSTTAWCKCGNDSLEGRGMNATQQGEQPDAMILEQTKSGPDQHRSVVEKNVDVDSKADPYIDDDDEDYRRARMFLQEFHLRRYRESPHACQTMTKRQHRRRYRFFVSPSAAMAATASLSAIPEEETNSSNNEEICDDDGTYDSNNNTPPSCLRKNIAVPSLASLVSTTSTVEGIRRNGSISAMLCSLSLAEESQEEQQQQLEQKPLALETADACTNDDEWLQQQHQLRGSRFSSPDAAMPLDDQWGFFCSSTESSRTSTAITTTTTSATATTVASCARGSHNNHGLLPHRNWQQQQQQSSDLVQSHHHYRQQPTSRHRVVVQSVGPN